MSTTIFFSNTSTKVRGHAYLNGDIYVGDKERWAQVGFTPLDDNGEVLGDYRLDIDLNLSETTVRSLHELLGTLIEQWDTDTTERLEL